MGASPSSSLTFSLQFSLFSPPKHALLPNFWQPIPILKPSHSKLAVSPQQQPIYQLAPHHLHSSISHPSHLARTGLSITASFLLLAKYQHPQGAPKSTHTSSLEADIHLGRAIAAGRHFLRPLVLHAWLRKKVQPLQHRDLSTFFSLP